LLLNVYNNTFTILKGKHTDGSIMNVRDGQIWLTSEEHTITASEKCLILKIRITTGDLTWYLTQQVVYHNYPINTD